MQGGFVHAFGVGRWRIEGTGVGGAYAIDEGAYVTQRGAVQHYSIIAHVHVVRLPVAQLGFADGRLPGVRFLVVFFHVLGLGIFAFLTASGFGLRRQVIHRLDAPRQQVDHRHLLDLVAVSRAQAQAHQELIAHRDFAHRLAFEVEVFVDDFQALVDRLELGALVETGFAEHEERSRAVGFFHHQLLRGARYGGARWLAGHLQQLLLLVAQPRGGLEGHVALRTLAVVIQGAQQQGRRQRVVALFVETLAEFIQQGGGHIVEQLGEVACQQVQVLGIVHQRVVIQAVAVPLIHKGAPWNLAEQRIGLAILLEQFVAGSQVGGAQVVLPTVLEVVFVTLADITQRAADENSLTAQQVTGVGAVAQFRQAFARAVGQVCQIGIGAHQQVFRHRQPALLGFDQEVGGVQAGVRCHVRVGRPQTKAAGLVLALAQHAHCTVEGLFGLGCIAAPDQRGHGLGHQLLGAGITIVVQVMLEAVGPYQRRGGHAQLHVAQLAEQFTGGLELFAGAVETAQAQGHAMRAQGPDRGGFGDLNAFAIRQYRDKTQVRRAEGLADLDLEFGGAFLARL